LSDRGKNATLIAAAVALFLLPWINKPFHIDDPLYLWTAQHIQTDPADFYGFEANWALTPKPMYESNQNPPLTAYYLAAAGWLLGWSETAMHLAMAPIAIAFGVGVFLLAGQFCQSPRLAALIAISAPGAALSFTTIMSDVPMVALWIWSFYFWTRGLKENRPLFLGVAGGLAGLAILAKYFGFSLLPLLAAYTLMSDRKRWKALIWLAIPAVILGAYQYWTWRLYGVGLFGNALGYAAEVRTNHAANLLVRAVTGLAFLGGCFGLYWLLLTARQSWKPAAVLALAWGAVLICIRSTSASWLPADPEAALTAGAASQLAFWAVCGAFTLGQCIHAASRSRDAGAGALLLWILGTVFYATFLNHFVNGRVMLPALPAIAILAARQLDHRPRDESRPAWQSWSYAALVPSIILSALICAADQSLARTAKSAAAEILDRHDPNQIQFSGHWGFHYYMEQGGATPMDAEQLSVAFGGLYVTPSNNSNPIYLEPAQIQQALPGSRASLELHETQPLPWLATMDIMGGAGFHSANWGPVPFLFGPVPTEQYAMIRVDRAP